MLHRFELRSVTPARFVEFEVGDGDTTMWRTGLVGHAGRTSTVEDTSIRRVLLQLRLLELIGEGYVQVASPGDPNAGPWFRLPPLPVPAAGEADLPEFPWTTAHDDLTRGAHHTTPAAVAWAVLRKAAVMKTSGVTWVRVFTPAPLPTVTNPSQAAPGTRQWPLPGSDAINARLNEPVPTAGPPWEDAAWVDLLRTPDQFYLNAATAVVHAWTAAGGLDHAVACARVVMSELDCLGGRLPDRARRVLYPLRAALEHDAEALRRALVATEADLGDDHLGRAAFAAFLRAGDDRLPTVLDRCMAQPKLAALLLGVASRADHLRLSMADPARHYLLDFRTELWRAVKHAGPAVVAAILPFDPSRWSPAASAILAHVLAYAGTPDALRALAHVAHRTHLGGIARHGLLARPRAALAVLRDVHTGPSAPVAADLADAIEAATRAPPEAAPLTACPPVLADPPWRGTAPKKAKPLTLTPRATTARYAGALAEPVPPSPGRFGWVLGISVADLSRMAPADARVAIDQAAAHTRRGRDLSASTLISLPRDTVAYLWNHPSFNLSTYDPPTPRLVAILGLDALPGLLRFAPSRVDLALPLLLRFDAAEVAPIAAHAFAHHRRARRSARAWLFAWPATAAAALLPIALGRENADARAARHALRELHDHGHATILHAEADHHGPAAIHALQAWLAADPMLNLPPKVKEVARTPSRATAPAILLRDGRALPPEAVDALVTMLSFYDLAAPYAGVQQVRDACEPRSLAAFAWWCVTDWLADGGRAADGWRFRALAALGDERTPARLEPLLRQWPQDGDHARATAGLDLLLAIGSEAALGVLLAIATRNKTRALQKQARERLDELADLRGLSSEALADRLAPQPDLDDDGALDLGWRGLRAMVSADLSVHLRDAHGHAIRELPEPDEAEVTDASTAAATLKALKTSLSQWTRDQARRLEVAMVTQRTWSPAELRDVILDHRVLFPLARGLVWRATLPDQTTARFRVAEDRALLDADDHPVLLPDGAVVQVAHRLDLPDDEAERWCAALEADRVTPPFAQLRRPIHRLPPEEADATSLARYHGQVTTARRLRGIDARGWQRNVSGSSGGYVFEHDLPLSDGRLVRLFLEPGYPLSGGGDDDPPMIEGIAVAESPWMGGHADPLHTVPPTVMSEVIAMLHSLVP